MNYYKSLAKNSILFGIGSFSSRAVTFLLLPLYTYYLSPGEYGKIDVLLTTILLLTPLISLQAMEVVFRYSMDTNNSRSTTLMNGLFFCLVGFSVLLLSTPVLVSIDIIATYLYLFVAALFFTMVDGVVKQFTRGIKKIKSYVVADVIYTIIFAISNIILIAMLGLGVKGYLISLTLGHIVSTLFLFYFARISKYFSVRLINPAMFKSMILYSLPLIPSAIMWWVMNASNRYFLSYFLGFEATGIYAVATKLPIILITLNIIFFQAWQISAVETFNTPSFKEKFSNVYNILSFLLVFCISVIIILIKPFFSIVIAEQYHSAWIYVPFLLVGVLFAALSGYWGVVYIASKRTSGALFSTGAGAIINIILNMLLIPMIGIYGAVFSTVVAYFIMWVIRVIHIHIVNGVIVGKAPIMRNMLLIFIQIYIVFQVTESIYSYFYQIIIIISLLLINRRILSDTYRVLQSQINLSESKSIQYNI
jgi:O-antigen/teichoic acid export membrane protein